MKGGVRLTFTARDAAHAAKIAAAVAAVDSHADEILVLPNSEGAPAGHTYRTLCAGERAGLLRARRTSLGLMISRPDLEAYERALSAKRAEKRAASRPHDPSGDPADSNVADLTEARIAAIERATGRRRT